jgi:HD-GYP domain-containing protein (c-di-GMP phosphodiesterase class II)
LSDQFILLLKDRERLDTERQMMLASITSLVTALEARDAYTRGHTEAVAEIVIGMATHINVSEEEIKTLSLACKLHDLGKIGVPDNVLLKPGRLTDEEFAVIKKHPVVGAQILQAIPTLREMMPVILHHHERFDGKGYPSGLHGKENHFWARMSAVADTYHAITSDRPYRQGMSREKGLQIIAEVKGTQLCPESVEIFMDWIALQEGKGYVS